MTPGATQNVLSQQISLNVWIKKSYQHYAFVPFLLKGTESNYYELWDPVGGLQPNPFHMHTFPSQQCRVTERVSGQNIHSVCQSSDRKSTDPFEFVSPLWHGSWNRRGGRESRFTHSRWFPVTVKIWWGQDEGMMKFCLIFDTHRIKQCLVHEEQCLCVADSVWGHYICFHPAPPEAQCNGSFSTVRKWRTFFSPSLLSVISWNST